MASKPDSLTPSASPKPSEKEAAFPRPQPVPDMFHLFPNLPTELRHYIWELAVRPDYREGGIQYFHIAENLWAKNDTATKCPSHDTQDPVWQRSDLVLRFLSNSHSVPLIIMAPGLSALDQASLGVAAGKQLWFKGNRSLYTIDGGLWTASWESRYIMMRQQRHLPDIWARLLVETDTLPFCLIVRPQKDIFCLSFDRVGENLDKICWSSFLSQLPFWRTLPGTEPNPAIAFEFTSDWLVDLPKYPVHFGDLRNEGSPRGVVIAMYEAWFMGRLPYSLRIWLIDRTVKDSSHRIRHARPTMFVDNGQWYASPGVRPWENDEIWNGKIGCAEDFCLAAVCWGAWFSATERPEEAFPDLIWESFLGGFLGVLYSVPPGEVARLRGVSDS